MTTPIRAPSCTLHRRTIGRRHAGDIRHTSRGAWRVIPAGTIAAVGENFLMLHALETGTVPVTLKIPAVLTPWGQLSTGVEPALKHTVELPAGQTALYRPHCPFNE